MKVPFEEGKKVAIAGYVGTVEKKTETLYIVPIANNKGNDKAEWINVGFCNPQDGQDGRKLANLAKKIITGQFVSVCATVKTNGDYQNYYAYAVELGPKPKN